jgi:hypothetical protein
VFWLKLTLHESLMVRKKKRARQGRAKRAQRSAWTKPRKMGKMNKRRKLPFARQKKQISAPTSDKR